MTEPRDVRHLLEMADRAAIDGDFSSADQLLRDAARIQEAELGPLHPDLASTLTNLAIVAEKTGRLGDAETFYRRAAAVASASLPADDPVVAESRLNLEDFCRERGLPIGPAAIMTPPAQDTVRRLDGPVPEVAAGPAATVAAVQAASQPLTAPRRSSRPLVWAATGAIVLITVAFLVRGPWSSDEEPPTGDTAASATEPAPPSPAIPAPIEQSPPPIVASGDDRKVVSDKPASSAPTSGGVSLTAAQLCKTFSTSGATWRCDPPGDTVAPGSIVFYTRVRSSRDAAVVHRWYREDMLQQAVKLPIRANPSEGYRTYSRQRVDGVGSWRVEVRSADGDLLHEQRFAVR
ncbi:MAG TPA: DUF2914 domain-containing protein [Vicinamibacterales bacterium]|nr:DUF2914 domain-containing protein [Vicinamibacterales bacterium]